MIKAKRTKDDTICSNRVYSFENFYPGQINRDAFSIVQRIAQGQKELQVITVLHGSNGTGKTHLLRALQIESNYQRIQYISVGELARQVENAVNDEAFDALLDYYKGYELMLLDDMQYIAGRELLQSFLIHIIKEMQPPAQVVMAADILPDHFLIRLQEVSEIRYLKLHNPEYATLCQIVKSKATQLGLNQGLNERLTDWILASCEYKAYRIESVLRTVQALGII